MSADLEALVQDQGIALGERFAGAWANSDGSVTVGLTSGPAPRELESDTRVHTVTRRFGTANLDKAIDTAAKRLNALLKPDRSASWPFSAKVNVIDNIVDVALDPSQASRRAEVEAALSDMIREGTVRIVSDSAVDQRPKCGTRANCATPFRGGIEVDSSTGFVCTFGFVMRRANGIRAMSTASHCPGSPSSHAGRAVGSTVFTQDSGSIDFKVIAETNQNEAVPTNWVFRDTSPTVAIMSKITSPGPSLIGNNICSEGLFGGTRCGALLNYNATWHGRPGFGLVANSACQGDSGSPILNNATARAYGFLTGGPDGCAGPNYFTWVPNAEVGSGYTVLLTSTTDALGPGQRMNTNMQIVSSSGVFNAINQGDGNFVVYEPGVPRWASNTGANPGAFVVMQNDGNLVVYRADGLPLWSTGTFGNPGAWLLMQNDGNLVVYRADNVPLWHCC